MIDGAPLNHLSILTPAFAQSRPEKSLIAQTHSAMQASCLPFAGGIYRLHLAPVLKKSSENL